MPTHSIILFIPYVYLRNYHVPLLSCRFEATLAPLPQIPEMTFDRNILRITHREGFGFEFSALDALKLVDAEHDHMKVAVSETWKATR